MSTIPALIYLIACHGGPGAHFAEFAKELSQRGHSVEILATGPAFDKLKGLGATEFNPEGLNIDDPLCQQILAAKVAQLIGPGAAVVTDVGHILMARVQEAIAKQSSIRRFAYYDNPEPFVPGGYSETAAKVMKAAKYVLYSNKNLAVGPKKIGIGYYPVISAQMLKSARYARHEIIRRQFLKQQQLVDTGQKILVYFGGNNDVYFEKAFPAFLNLLDQMQFDPSEYLVLVQQHPGAKGKDLDRKLALNHPMIFSEMSSEEAQVLSDAALYYQTSMGPQFVLAGIPTIQIGHDTYSDILVKNGLAPSVTTQESFQEALSSLEQEKKVGQICDDLGIANDWADRLETALLAPAQKRSILSYLFQLFSKV